MKKGTKLAEYDPAVLARAYEECKSASYGMKTEMQKRWAKVLNISPQHLNRLLKNFRQGWNGQLLKSN